jgi:hypothetical protein
MSDELSDLREQVAVLREGRAAHAEQINAIATRVDSIADDVKTILGYMERTKGSWKTLVALGGVVGAIVEAGHWAVGWLHATH